MHDPERPRAAAESEESWDQWFGRTYGSSRYRRLILIWGVVFGIAIVALYFSGNSNLFG